MSVMVAILTLSFGILLLTALVVSGPSSSSVGMRSSDSSDSRRSSSTSQSLRSDRATPSAMAQVYKFLFIVLFVIAIFLAIWVGT